MSTKLLTAREIATAKPRQREYLLSDGESLYLRVRPTGAKDWFFNYTFQGSRKKLAINETDLIDIRAKADIYSSIKD